MGKIILKYEIWTTQIAHQRLVFYIFNVLGVIFFDILQKTSALSIRSPKCNQV